MMVQVTPNLAVAPQAIAGLALEDVSFNGDGTAWELRIHLYGGSKPLVAGFRATRDAGEISEAHVWYQRLIEMQSVAQQKVVPAAEGLCEELWAAPAKNDIAVGGQQPVDQ